MAQDGDRLTEGATDAAALAAAGLAIVLTTYMEEGRYDLLGAVVSLTLLGILVAYLFGRERLVRQRIALAAVAGLVAIPSIGFVIELVQAGNDWRGFFSWYEQSERVKEAEGSELASTVGD